MTIIRNQSTNLKQGFVGMWEFSCGVPVFRRRKKRIKCWTTAPLKLTIPTWHVALPRHLAILPAGLKEVVIGMGCHGCPDGCGVSNKMPWRWWSLRNSSRKNACCQQTQWRWVSGVSRVVDGWNWNAGNLILIPLPFSGWPWSISCKFAVLSDGDWIACHKNWVLEHAKLCFVSLFFCMAIDVYVFRLMIKPGRVCWPVFRRVTGNQEQIAAGSPWTLVPNIQHLGRFRCHWRFDKILPVFKTRNANALVGLQNCHPPFSQ